MSFKQTFKNIDDPLYKDSGSDSELDDIVQTSWVMPKGTDGKLDAHRY